MNTNENHDDLYVWQVLHLLNNVKGLTVSIYFKMTRDDQSFVDISIAKAKRLFQRRGSEEITTAYYDADRKEILIG